MNLNTNRLENPLVSVIIPNYNHAAYVGEAIHSVLNQTYDNFEIIVIDDGSTDNSREVILNTSDKVIYIWQENQGLSAARNTGIRAAKGEIIGLLDADDMYEPKFLSTLSSILKVNANVDGVYCGYRFVDHLNNPLFQIEVRNIQPNKLFNSLLNGNFFDVQSLLIRRRCYVNVGPFDVSLRACEDWDMWLRITKNFKIIGTDKILTRHRVLPGSMSSDPVRMLNNRLDVLSKHLNPIVTDPVHWTTTQRCAYGHVYLASATEYLQIHDEDKAYDCLLKMVHVYPELLRDLDTFYELGCGDQLKGNRGNCTDLNIQFAAKTLINTINKLFNDQRAPEGIRSYRRLAYTNAYLALGLFSYGAHNYPLARSYLIRALFFNPIYGIQHHTVTTLIKSLTYVRTISHLIRRHYLRVE